MGGRRIRDGRGQGLQPQSSRRSTPAAPPDPCGLLTSRPHPREFPPLIKGEEKRSWCLLSER